MRKLCVITAIISLLCILAACSTSAAVYYTDSTLFTDILSGSHTETFDSSYTSSGSFAGPLDSSTDNTKFKLGDIEDGIRFSVSANGLYRGKNGGDWSLGCQQIAPGVTMTIALLTADITAIGMDIVDDYGMERSPSVKVYDTANVEIGSWTGYVAKGGRTFFGVSSSVAIGKITIWSGPSPAIDNVTFGNTKAPAAVPEPATLLGFGIPMLMVGLGKIKSLRK